MNGSSFRLLSFCWKMKSGVQLPASLTLADLPQRYPDFVATMQDRFGIHTAKTRAWLVAAMGGSLAGLLMQ